MADTAIIPSGADIAMHNFLLHCESRNRARLETPLAGRRVKESRI